MPRCNLCLEYVEELRYKDGDYSLCCPDCAENIDMIDEFLNNFHPENYDEESEKWKS